jgi:hypothetical protein
MSDPRIDEPTRSELIGHVERDHNRVSDFTARIVTMRTALASLAATISATAIGVTVANGAPATAFGGTIVVLVLGAIDLSYSARYRALRSQARHLERALNANFKYLYRSAGKKQSADLLKSTLAAVELGQVSSLPRLSIQAWWRAHDARTLIFALLAILAAGAGLLTPTPTDDSPVCFEGPGGAVVKADELPEIIEGELTIFLCE